MLSIQPKTSFSQAQLSIRLEMWVDSIIYPPSNEFIQTVLPSMELIDYINLCRCKDYRYSSLITIFRRSCLHLDLFSDRRQPTIHQLDQLSQHIAQQGNTHKNFLCQKHSTLKYEAKQRLTELSQLTMRILDHYARVLVIRVDLGYIGGAQSTVTIDQVCAHLAALRYKKSTRKGVFANIKGYAWCIEQGVDKGYHIHLACFYAGYQHQNDWFIANSIGQMWLEIVGEGGMFYSCNTPAVKKNYLDQGLLGVGMIHRDNPVEVQNAIQAVSYLAGPLKTPQALRIRPKGSRTFGTGQF